MNGCHGVLVLVFIAKDKGCSSPVGLAKEPTISFVSLVDLCFLSLVLTVLCDCRHWHEVFTLNSCLRSVCLLVLSTFHTTVSSLF